MLAGTQRKWITLLVGMSGGTITLEDGLAATIWPRDTHPREVNITHISLYMNVHSIFIHNSSKLKTKQMSFNKRMVKNKTKQNQTMRTLTRNLWWAKEVNLKWLHFVITFLKWQNHKNGDQISGYVGQRGSGDTREVAAAIKGKREHLCGNLLCTLTVPMLTSWLY